MTVRQQSRLKSRLVVFGASIMLSALLLAACATTTHTPREVEPPAPAASLVPPEPTPHIVYETWQAGHLEEARQMMAGVLRTHPQSALAHYVAAWIYTGSGDVQRGRAELERAEELDPSDSFANPHSIQQLRERLQGGAMQTSPEAATATSPAR